MKNKLKWVFGIVLLFVTLSCNTVKKSSSSTVIKQDSVSLKIRDSVGVKKTDSSNSKIDSGSYEKETVFVYDTVYSDTGHHVQYIPRIIKITEKGKYNKSEVGNMTTYDSGRVRASDSTVTAKEQTVITKQKETKRFPLTLMIGVIIAGLLAVGYIVWKKK